MKMYLIFKYMELASFVMLGIVFFKVCKLLDYYTKQSKMQTAMMKRTLQNDNRS